MSLEPLGFLQTGEPVAFWLVLMSDELRLVSASRPCSTAQLICISVVASLDQVRPYE